MSTTRIALLLALATIPTTTVGAREGPVEPPPRGGQAMPEPPPVRTLPTFAAFVCIHGHEAAWNDPGDPYHGGLQMDWNFMRAYGRDMLQKYHGRGAEAWTPAEQIRVAHRGWLARGFGPWPNTRKPCGV